MRFIGVTLFGIGFALVIGGPVFVVSLMFKNELPDGLILPCLLGWPCLLVATAVIGNLAFGRQRPGFGFYYVVNHTFRK